MKNLFKHISVMALAFFFAGTGLFATSTRSAGMGLDAQPWAADGQLPYVYQNPAFLADFSNTIFAETQGSATASWGGVIFQPVGGINLAVLAGLPVASRHNAGVGGIYETNNSAIALALSGAVTNTGHLATEILNPAIALNHNNAAFIMTLDALGFPLGLAIAYARGYYGETYELKSAGSTTTEALTLIESSMRIILGTKMALGGMAGDFAVIYQTHGINHEYTSKITGTQNYTVTNKNTGLGDIILVGRVSQKMGKSNNVHMMAQIGRLNSSTETDLNESVGSTKINETHSGKGFQIMLGASDELQATKNVLVFFGISADWQKWTTEDDWTIPNVANNTSRTDTTKTLVVPIFLGMEAQIADTWQGRFGVSSNMLDINPNYTLESKTGGAASSSTTSTSKSWNDPGSNLTLGVSHERNNISFDWNLRVPLFTSGPNFIGGGAPGLASMFAVLYKFGK